MDENPLKIHTIVEHHESIYPENVDVVTLEYLKLASGTMLRPSASLMSKAARCNGHFRCKQTLRKVDLISECKSGKKQKVLDCQEIVKCSKEDAARFLARCVTMGETFVYPDPEQWESPSSPALKKILD